MEFVMSKTERKEHPHAALIEQYARDARKTDKPWEWWKIKHNEIWKQANNCCPSFSPQNEYMRIPQWEIDGLKIGDEVIVDDVHTAIIMKFRHGYIFDSYFITTDFGDISNTRVKKSVPKTININGFEVPEPLRTIEDGMVIFMPSLILNVVTFRDALTAGFCHATNEAAELHAKALISFTKKQD
jgi:hypothetical protein